jgi:hypothetical protein
MSTASLPSARRAPAVAALLTTGFPLAATAHASKHAASSVKLWTQLPYKSHSKTCPRAMPPLTRKCMTP